MKYKNIIIAIYQTFFITLIISSKYTSTENISDFYPNNTQSTNDKVIDFNDIAHAQGYYKAFYGLRSKTMKYLNSLTQLKDQFKNSYSIKGKLTISKEIASDFNKLSLILKSKFDSIFQKYGEANLDRNYDFYYDFSENYNKNKRYVKNMTLNLTKEINDTIKWANSQIQKIVSLNT